MILTVGGSGDPHVARLASRLQAAGRPFQQLVLEDGVSARLAWDPRTEDLLLDGQPVQPTAIFLRHPRMDEGETGAAAAHAFRAATWRTVLLSYALNVPDVQFMNRYAFDRPLHKPHVLARAKAAKLDVPETLITNCYDQLKDLSPEEHIVKPVLGGLPAITLGEALRRSELRSGAAAAPAIVQKRLRGPEYRVYCVGRELFGFRIDCLDPALVDYRLAESEEQVQVEVWASIPEPLAMSLGSLMDYFGLDFCAADFKAEGADEHLFFLDLNEEPMFAEIDELAGGALTDAMIRWLTAPHAVRSVGHLLPDGRAHQDSLLSGAVVHVS